MSRIGRIDLTPRNDGTQFLKGEFTTAHHAVDFRLDKIEGDRPEKAPTHEIVTRGGHGRFAVIGMAWEHTIKRGDNAGAPMYMLEFDDPDLPQIRLTAFPVMQSNEHGLNCWALETERKRRQSPAGAGNGASDDEIPY